MKIKNLALILLITLCLGIFVGQAAGGNLPLPGSKEDPLVTQSYVDDLIREKFGPLFLATDRLVTRVSDLNDSVEELEKLIKPREVKLALGKKEAYIGEERRTLDIAPFTENGRTLVPFRFVGEALGATVGWIGETQTVTYRLGSTTLKLKIGSKDIWVGDKVYRMDVPAKLKNGRTLVPVRMVSEQLGFYVQWLPETREIVIRP
ncbi:MAG: copper amine oxidase-like [Clostridiales bacterium]|nr:copper amine oxidase-like [Clostridiales bacterium]